MKIKIVIPARLANAYDAWSDWINMPVWWIGGRFEVRRIDVLLVLAGIFCVSYYWWTSGWQGALVGGAMYVFMAMLALWVL
jgi:hypothetical protein